jgi:hypothetical protein
MGLRPTNSDEKRAQWRMPGEYGTSLGGFFRGAVALRTDYGCVKALRGRCGQCAADRTEATPAKYPHNPGSVRPSRSNPDVIPI